MKKKLLTAITVALVLALIVSSVIIVRQKLDDRRAIEAVSLASQVAGAALPSAPPEPQPSELPAAPEDPAPAAPEVTSPPEPEDPYILQMEEIDLDALRAENSEVVGWLYIKDTDISHPLMQHSNNDYYLSHAWNRIASRSGAIFLEAQVDPGLGDFNTIVYGHNMRTDRMFSHLGRFADRDFWEAHPAVYILTEDGVYRYAIFACWEAKLQDSPYYLKVTRDQDKETFLDQSLSGSVIDTGIVPTAEDRFLTLSTCTGRGHSTRWVVQAVLERAPSGK